MTENEALKYLKWRFTKSNIRASKKDLSALNTVISGLNSELDYKINSNINFCKLFIYSFKKMVLTNAINNNYKSIDYLSIYSKLQEILNTDPKSHIESLNSELKGIEIQHLINTNNLNAETISSLSTEQETNNKIRKTLSQFLDAYGTD